MTTSVFILSITDMRKDNMSKKLFHLTHFTIKIVAVIMFVVYLSLYVSKYNYDMLLSFVAPIVFFAIFLLYNRLLVHFHKKGFYTPEQAVEFYEKCREQDIAGFQEENLDKATDIYFSIFGTDKYLGAETLPAHMADIYAAGKKQPKNS